VSCRDADALPEAPAPEPVAPVEPVALPVAEPVAEPVALPVAEPVAPDPLPVLFSSLPRTSTWLLTYFCKSDWLPSSLIRVIPAMPEDDADPVALPAVPVLAPPVLLEPEPLPILAFVRTKPPPRVEPLAVAPVEPAPVEPAPVEPAPVEPAPVEPAPVEPAPAVPVDPPESLWRQPVTVTC
jgi:hypothetical protein